jgi:hypothetical protein
MVSVSSANHANPSIGIDRTEARLAFNAAGIATSTHRAITYVTNVARYRRSRELLFLPIAWAGDVASCDVLHAVGDLSVCAMRGPSRQVEWRLGGSSRQGPRLVHHSVRVVSS